MIPYVELLMLTATISYIVDISGFMDQVKMWLSMLLKRNISSIKPLDCSACMSLWLCIALSLYNGVPIITSLFIGVAASVFSQITSIALFKLFGLIERL